MTADVVVVSFNHRDLLASCLEHLARQTVPCRLVVVDNGSSDGTADMVRERYPAATVVALEDNRGFGAGVAAGVAVGEGEAVVLVNDDADVRSDFVAEIVAPLEDPAVGMVAGLLLVPGTDLVDSLGIELDATLAAYSRGRYAPPGVLAMPSGGAAAYRRSAFAAAGGFDPALFAYGEDVDLGLRLRAAGWRAAEAPRAVGEHRGGASFGVDSPWQRRLSGFARGFLLRRYGRLGVRTLLFEALVVGWGLLRHRTTVPLRSRITGWRAAGTRRDGVDPAAIDTAITAREAFRRLRAR